MMLLSYFLVLSVYCFASASSNPLINQNQPLQTVTGAVPGIPKTVTCTVTKLVEKHLVQKKTKTEWKIKTRTALKLVTKSKIITKTKTATPKQYTIYKTKTFTFATRPGSTPPITLTKTIFKTPTATRTVTSLTTTFRIITPSCPVPTTITFTTSSTATGLSSSTQATVTVTEVSSFTETLLETVTVTETANPTSSGPPSLPSSTTEAAGRTVTVTTKETSRVTVTKTPICMSNSQPTISSSSSSSTIATSLSTPTFTWSSTTTTPPSTSTSTSSTSTTLDSTPGPTITPLCNIPAISNGNFESPSLAPWIQTISSGKINAETSGLLTLFNHTPNGRKSWLFEYTTSSITITLSQPARFCPVEDKTPYRVSLWMRKISNPNGYECSVTLKINGAEVGRTKASRETMDWTLVGPFLFVLGEKGVGAAEDGEIRIGVICEGTLATSRMMALDDIVVEPARVDQ